jgi:beta-glucosidase
MALVSLSLLASLISSLPALAQGGYKDPKTPVEQRVEDLLKQMTLDEKIEMLSGSGFMDTHGNARLGIPALKMSDGPMGTRCYGPSTAYPNGVILAATWDPDQALRAGQAIGRDARARGVHILLAPGMNLYRAPMCGRNFEYLGEDPLVAGTIASAYIRGVQSQGVAATAKHFAGNEQEYNRHNLNTQVDERTLRELYLKPFAMAVKSGVWCVMDSYNPLNGIHATQNDWLNNIFLKGELGFKGVVMSDWWACYNTAGMANGGLDLEMPKGKYFNVKALMPLIDGGKVTEATINDKIRRQLRMAFSMGWFDRPQLDASIPRDDPQNAKVALQGAREGIVLLKNAGNLLPLDRAKVRKIVLLGRNADPAVVGASGSAFTHPFHSVSTLAGLKAAAGSLIQIVRVPWTPNQNAVPAEFADQVKGADAVIVCVGFNDQQDHGADSKRSGSEGEGADRTYALPQGQPALIQSAAALNPHTIVILNAGGSVRTADWIDQAPVLLDAFYPGQEGGTAIAEILFGDTNPSGKLPFSWEKRWEDSAAYGNYPTAGNPYANTYKEGVFLGYRWFDAKGIAPLFPFGYGLSYTTFALSDPIARIENSDSNSGSSDIEVTVTVRNTGARAGVETIQAYVHPPTADAPRPVRELKAFSKVALQPGESKSVTMHIARGDLAYWNPASKNWVVTSGGYTVEIGDSSRNLPLKTGFSL